MFGEIHSVKGRRNRAMAGSFALHLGLLAAFLLHRPPIVDLNPRWLANGSGGESYRVIYAPPGGEASAEETKLALSHAVAARRARPKSSSTKRPADHLELPADAKPGDRNLRAGSALGTVISGPIDGHEVHIAYPVIFPDPLIVRSELPPEVKGDVVIRVTINPEGYVVETTILQAIGHGIDEKVVAALRQWRYKPATLDGVPVASKHDVHFHFPS